MRHLASSILLALALLAPAARAQSGATFAHSGRFALGLGGSNLVSGLSGKLYVSDRGSVQAVLGLWYPQGAALGIDGLFDMPSFFQSEPLRLNWYLGAGGATGSFGRFFALGVAGILGLGLQFERVPLELTIELRPTFFLGDHVWSGFWFGSGGAIRYFF